MNEAPVHIACGQSHVGPVCPDGKVMCQICFNRVPISQLNSTEEDIFEDVCKGCAAK